MNEEEIDWSKPLPPDEEEIDWSKPLEPSNEYSMLSQAMPKPNKFMEHMETAKNFLKNYALPAAGGAAEGIGNMGGSMANLLLETGAGNPLLANAYRTLSRGQKIPKIDIRDQFPEGFGTSAAFHVGKFASELIPFAKGAQLAQKVGKLSPLAAGALTGATIGGDTPNERLIGGLLGTVGAGALHAPKLSNKAVGNQIIDKANSLQKEFKGKFDNFFDMAEKSGVKSVTRKGITPEMLKKYSRVVTQDEQALLKDFMKNPSFENAHWLQSDLATAIRRLKKNPKNNAVTGGINAASEMRKNLIKSMNNQLEHKGAKELGHEYRQLRNEYRKEMAPYLKNKSIRNARMKPEDENFMEASRLPSELYLKGKGNDSFRKLKGHEHPDLKINRLLSGPIGKSLLGIAGLGGTGAVGAIISKLLEDR